MTIASRSVGTGATTSPEPPLSFSLATSLHCKPPSYLLPPITSQPHFPSSTHINTPHTSLPPPLGRAPHRILLHLQLTLLHNPLPRQPPILLILLDKPHHPSNRNLVQQLPPPGSGGGAGARPPAFDDIRDGFLGDAEVELDFGLRPPRGAEGEDLEADGLVGLNL
ncbi:hypothetical protein EX30DRAFT_345109 [Ascodesmis nigricans]|uniref:Uncharacterized protein n=1 Tax=Ascodesmis nigricans TaxID=341454 RepID=A0A4S2MNW5_9PEZI|nr:hypothetical protein EX30DRAFT_345109 [Ascodesmis nigricans]